MTNNHQRNQWGKMLVPFSKARVFIGLTVFWCAAASQLAAETLTIPSVSAAGLMTGSARISDLVVLEVNKDTLEAKLMTWPDDVQSAALLRKFRIAIGKAEGDKQVEGDNKTPEGIYFAKSHIFDGQLPPKYGPLAIPIDFPNAMDKSAGKTGHGIWLHGVDDAARIEEAKVTEGCVAFFNDDILRLGNWLKPDQAVVVIGRGEAEVNNPEDLVQVRAQAEGWMAAWAGRSLDAYISFYHPEFRSGRMDRAAYRDYKDRVFGTYKRMSVDFTNLRVLTHPKYSVALMNQDFNGDDRFVSVGRKVLFFTKDADGVWRIVRETFGSKLFNFPAFGDAEIAALVPESKGQGSGGAAVDGTSPNKSSPNL